MAPFPLKKKQKNNLLMILYSENMGARISSHIYKDYNPWITLTKDYNPLPSLYALKSTQKTY